MYLRIAGIEPESVVDGPGVRFSIFMQGCLRHCPGCQNPQTWDSDGGYEVTTGQLFKDILSKDLVTGVTFSGGEPLNQEASLAQLAAMLKNSGYNLWCFTGYCWEEVQQNAVIPYLDVLVDGPFVEAEKSLDLWFCGSRNQRLIDVPASRSAGQVVLFNPEEENPCWTQGLSISSGAL